MVKKKTEEKEIIVIPPFRISGLRLFIVGTSGLCINRMAEKAKHELVFPARKGNRAERELKLKHDPIGEFRSAAYVNQDPNSPTYLQLPSRMFHRSFIEAAAATPGATKTELAWLLSIANEYVPVYGLPRLSMKIVRQSGIGRAPDTRFRPLLPQWAVMLDLNYLASRIDQTNVINLVAGAGMLMGVGDFRGQKAGPWGKFRLASQDDPELVHILKTGGRDAQIKAMEEAQPADYEAEEILSYYSEQLEKRTQEQKTRHAETTIAAARTARDGIKPRREKVSY